MDTGEPRHPTGLEPPDDGLDPARGILLGFAISIGAWAITAALIYLTARLVR